MRCPMPRLAAGLPRNKRLRAEPAVDQAGGPTHINLQFRPKFTHKHVRLPQCLPVLVSEFHQGWRDCQRSQIQIIRLRPLDRQLIRLRQQENPESSCLLQYRCQLLHTSLLGIFGIYPGRKCHHEALHQLCDLTIAIGDIKGIQGRIRAYVSSCGTPARCASREAWL